MSQTKAQLLGNVLTDIQLNAQGDLRFADADSSNYVGFQAPATVASNLVWTLPSADAAASGYALVSDGSGTLSWAAMSGGISGITIQEEGSSLSTAATTLNFVGSSVAATGSGATKTITVTGGLSSDSQSNTIGGTDAGNALTSTAYRNTIIGHDAGKLVDDGDDNVLIGDSAGEALTTGSTNVGIGKAAGPKTGGRGSVAVGAYSLQNCTNTSAYNTALGISSARFLTTGVESVNIGGFTAHSLTTGSQNITIGYNAGDNITTGSNNIAIGHGTDPSSATVSNEVTIGNSSSNKFRIPGINFELTDGIITLKNGGTRSEVRWYCESSNAHYASIKAPAHADFSGDLTFVLPSGYGSSGQFLQSNGSGGTTWAAASGGVTSDAQGNTVGGTNAGDSFSGTDAVKNTLFGYNAGTSITDGDNNTAFGYDALADGNGGNNTAFGYEALKVNGGSGFLMNTAVGGQALRALTTGNQNVAVGQSA